MHDQEQTQNQAPAAQAEATAQRDYHAPVFTHHGSAANIVRNLEGIGGDGGTGFPSDTLS
jgi:hypothetical protein